MREKIPRNVLVLGIVSLFNDISSEMIYPIMPIFLTAVLGAPVVVVGFIEGIAEATASFTKFGFGYLSDRLQRRKIFVTIGYISSSLSKLLIATASSWYFVLVGRFLDRLGKGERTAARDSILLENASAQNRGFIFGFHRAADSAGAIVGPLLAIVLLLLLNNNLRLIIFISIFPTLIGVLLIILLVKEVKKTGKKIVEINLNFRWSQMDRRFKLFLGASVIFALGNSADAFLLLRAKQLGLTTILVTLSYVLYSLFQTIFAIPMGKLADTVGPKKIYSIGLLIFSFVYFSFGIIKNPLWVWFLFPIYGFYIAMTDGVSKAYISKFTTTETSGTYFGFYQMLISICVFVASLVGGILWTKIGSSATFYYGATMAGLAFITLFVFRLKKLV